MENTINLRKYNITISNNGFFFVRRFSLFHWFLGHEKKKCKYCNNITYWETSGIIYSCLECGGNQMWDMLDEMLINTCICPDVAHGLRDFDCPLHGR